MVAHGYQGLPGPTSAYQDLPWGFRRATGDWNFVDYREMKKAAEIRRIWSPDLARLEKAFSVPVRVVLAVGVFGAGVWVFRRRSAKCRLMQPADSSPEWRRADIFRVPLKHGPFRRSQGPLKRKNSLPPAALLVTT